MPQRLSSMDAGGTAEQSRMLEIARRIALRQLIRARAWRQPLDALYYLSVLLEGAILIWIGGEFSFLQVFITEHTSDLQDWLLRSLCLVPGAALAAFLLRIYQHRQRNQLRQKFRQNLIEERLLASAKDAAISIDLSGLQPEQAYARQAGCFTNVYRRYRRLCKERGLQALPNSAFRLEVTATLTEWTLPLAMAGFTLTAGILTLWPSDSLAAQFDEAFMSIALWMMGALVLAAPFLFYLRRWHISTLLGEVIRQLETPPGKLAG